MLGLFYDIAELISKYKLGYNFDKYRPLAQSLFLCYNNL